MNSSNQRTPAWKGGGVAPGRVRRQRAINEQGLCRSTGRECVRWESWRCVAIGTSLVILSGGIDLSVGAALSVGALIALAMVALGVWLSQCARFGRSVDALGGSEASARLTRACRWRRRRCECTL